MFQRIANEEMDDYARVYLIIDACKPIPEKVRVIVTKDGETRIEIVEVFVENLLHICPICQLFDHCCPSLVPPIQQESKNHVDTNALNEAIAKSGEFYFGNHYR